MRESENASNFPSGDHERRPAVHKSFVELVILPESLAYPALSATHCGNDVKCLFPHLECDRMRCSDHRATKPD